MSSKTRRQNRRQWTEILIKSQSCSPQRYQSVDKIMALMPDRLARIAKDLTGSTKSLDALLTLKLPVCPNDCWRRYPYQGAGAGGFGLVAGAFSSTTGRLGKVITRLAG